MLYSGAQRVKLPNSSKISCLLSPLDILLRWQAFQRYMITDVVFWWKVVLIFGHFAATLNNFNPNYQIIYLMHIEIIFVDTCHMHRKIVLNSMSYKR